MSLYADSVGDRSEVLGEIHDRVRPQLRDYFIDRGLAHERADQLAARVLHSLRLACDRYADGTDVLEWAFSFARQIANQESPEPSLRQEALTLAVLGLRAKQIARLLAVPVAEIRKLVVRSQTLIEQSLAPVGPRLDDENPLDIRVPGYRLLELLDTGGMGYVFAAEHVTLGVQRAIKVMKDQPGEDRLAVERFLGEARMMIDISHDNIVRVFHADKLDDGRAWYAMERLPGRTLAAHLRAVKRLAWSQVAKIVRQICAGLAHVHARSIVHCDIKPANCFVVGDDLEHPRVKLLDFGVARLQRDGRESGNGNDVFGTPAYMAPELFRGERPDARTDVYAIGVMMFEMLTGRVPFEGATWMSVAVDKATLAPPKLASAGLSYPRGVERIVARALAANPTDRFQSVPQLEAAIAALDESGRGRLPFSGWRRETLRNAAYAATISAVFASVGTALLLHEPARAPVRHDFVAGVESVRDLVDACRAEHPDAPAATAKLQVLGSDGYLTKVEVTGVDEDLGTCLNDALHKIRFEKSAQPYVDLEGTL
ncbi:MAG TPA: serine/threonine-protein kinase [Nannocystaceae bacterium]|nr:serine/threonine-protein kinase [Nannocystaceae bacterium]